MEERRARIILLDNHHLDLVIQVRLLLVHLYQRAPLYEHWLAAYMRIVSNSNTQRYISTICAMALRPSVSVCLLQVRDYQNG